MTSTTKRLKEIRDSWPSLWRAINLPDEKCDEFIYRALHPSITMNGFGSCSSTMFPCEVKIESSNSFKELGRFDPMTELASSIADCMTCENDISGHCGPVRALNSIDEMSDLPNSVTEALALALACVNMIRRDILDYADVAGLRSKVLRGARKSHKRTGLTLLERVKRAYHDDHYSRGKI